MNLLQAPALPFVRPLILFSVLFAAMSCHRSPAPEEQSPMTGSAPAPFPFNDILVESVEGFRQAVQELEPGDRILLQDGEYADIGNLSFNVKASAKKPVVIQPENPHQVVITGEMSWHISGQHITFSGLDFIDGRSVPTDKPYAGLIYASDGSDSIRFSSCRFISCEIERKENGKTKGRLITLHGDHHRFDHCLIYDPIGGGLAIKGPDRINDIAYKGSARVDHNIFRNMTRHRQLKDQGEALFLGTGFEHRGHRRIGAIVEYNMFDQANGDTHGEIITVKGSEVIMRHNLFVNAPGAWFEGGSHLSLRSTNHCHIYQNLFYRLGCGIWVTGKGHRIFNNFFVDIDYAGLMFPAGNIKAVTENEGVTMLDDTYFDMMNRPDVYGKISRGYGAAFRAAEDCSILHNSFSGLKRYAVIAIDKKNSDKGSLPVRGNLIANNLFESAPERRQDPFMQIQHPDLNTISHNVYRMEDDSKPGATGEHALFERWEPPAEMGNLHDRLNTLRTESTGQPAPIPIATDVWDQERNAALPVIGASEQQPPEEALASILPPVPPMPGSLKDLPLKADFRVFPQNVQAGNLLVLDAAHSAGTISAYHWNFGDGSESRSRGNAIAHRWLKAGEYRVTLTVLSQTGDRSVLKRTIVVEESRPPHI